MAASGRPWWRRWFGTRSERAAARFLRGVGLRVIDRNVTTPYGEVDLVALHDGCVVFVEVRSTGEDDTSRPAESVDLTKQRKLTDAALDYLRRRDLLAYPARFDVVAIAWPEGRREPQIDYHAHAFEAVGRGQMFS